MVLIIKIMKQKTKRALPTQLIISILKFQKLNFYKILGQNCPISSLQGRKSKVLGIFLRYLEENQIQCTIPSLQERKSNVLGIFLHYQEENFKF